MMIVLVTDDGCARTYKYRSFARDPIDDGMVPLT